MLSFSISHPLALNPYSLRQNPVPSGLTSAPQGGPTAPYPSEVTLTVQSFPGVSSVIGSVMLLQSIFFERGNPLHSRIWVNSAFLGRKFVSVGRNMLILQTRKNQ